MKIGDAGIERVVFECAIELLTKYGKSWSMDDLARESGMSKRTLYKIVGNKEELLFRCYADELVRSYQRVQQFLQQDTDYYALLDELPSIINTVINDIVITSSATIKTEYPRVARMIQEKVGLNRKLILDFFERGHQEGHLRQDVLPKTIENMVDALVEYHIAHSLNKLEFERNIHDGFAFLMKAIRK